MTNPLSFEIDSENSGLRLDRFLGSRKEVRTRSRAEKLLKSNMVSINGNPAKASYKLRLGDIVELQIPGEQESSLETLNLPLDILFEDADIIVVNKPAGLVMHPAAGHAQDTLVNALLHHTQDLSMGFHEQRPGIVHRLDRDTSGVIVIAKHDRAHEVLSSQFRTRTVHRIYFCLVEGNLISPEATIESLLARHPVYRKKFASRKDLRGKIIRDPLRTDLSKGTGKWAITSYKILKTNTSPPGQKKSVHLLRIKLGTGRTHQIRIHLSEWGAALLGDIIYGQPKRSYLVPRLALHAAELGFLHPRTNEPLLFTTTWPADFLPTLRALGFES